MQNWKAHIYSHYPAPAWEVPRRRNYAPTLFAPHQPRTVLRCCRLLVFLRSYGAGVMDWGVASGASSWGAAAADCGPTMLSFAGPSSSSTTSFAAEIQLQDFSVRRARSAGTGRRSRAAGGGVPEACAVDGCRSDLSRCREYHRRHKVCEAHSKTPVVLVGGQEMRFCQQCSR
ncbi:hypothetical protein EJB05_47529, partial [Eragrostis curvula]